MVRLDLSNGDYADPDELHENLTEQFDAIEREHAVATSRGRLDLAVRLAETVCLFEFKVTERAQQGAALAQLKARRHADKHHAPGRTVHLVGVEISAESRDIAAFETESA